MTSDTIPYALYLKFLKPAEAVSLVLALESLELVCLGEERVDENFSIVHYHFKQDEARKVVLHLEIEDSVSERINISIYQGASLNSIKELFTFLKQFDPDKVALIDQEAKNWLYINDMDSFERDAGGTKIPESWVNATEQKATLPIDFDEFCQNPLKLLRRSILLSSE